MGSIHVTNQDFDKVVLNAHKPVIVDFWAPWCGPCRTLSPKLDQIAIDYDGRIVVVKVNVDEQPELAKRFNVRSLPSILVFGEGKEQLRSVGDLSLRVMRTAIDQILATPPTSGNDKEALERGIAEAQQEVFHRAAAIVGEDKEYTDKIGKLAAQAQPLMEALHEETAPIKAEFDAKQISEEEFHARTMVAMNRLFGEERFKEAAEAYHQMMEAMTKAFAVAMEKVDSENHK